MYSLSRAALKPLLIVALLFVAACESAEERAEKHYQSSLELIEAGDVDRALVELRNVFDLNGSHREARLLYAKLQRDRGQMAEAYGQYLLSAEQYPDEIRSRRALAEMAAMSGNWEDAERHGRAAQKLAPDDPVVRAVIVALDYRAASLARDDAARSAAAEAARPLLAEHPDLRLVRNLLIDWLTGSQRFEEALDMVDGGLEVEPGDFTFHAARLQLLAQLRKNDGIGAELETMAARFPDDERVRTMLVAYYVQTGNLKAGEDFLRGLAEKAGSVPGPWLTVVAFQIQTGRRAEAAAELDRLIGDPAWTADDAVIFKAARAGLMFEDGQRDQAIASLETVLRDAKPSENIRKVKIALAQMLITTGNPVGARTRVEEVLAEDATNVEALKMRASFLIDEDEPGEAILALRTALDQSPRDASVLTLMALAHERDGSRDLAGERYALAVEVSGKAEAETLRYAQFLAQDKRYDPAKAVIIDALVTHPASLRLLQALAVLQIRSQDLDKAAATVSRIAALDDPKARLAADGLRAQLLLAQGKTDESADFLQSLADSKAGGSSVLVAALEARLRAGDAEAASIYLDEQLAVSPDDPDLRLLRASLDLIMARPETAQTTYAALIAERPQDERPVRGLYRLYMSQGDTEKAAAVLTAGLSAMPESASLQMMRASEFERDRKFEEAIAIYEALYERNSGNAIIANNLASTITTYRDDPESLERAFAIARRLRGLNVPAFQDTYGWIAYRRGDYAEALSSLEPAAKGLPADPLVQFHLGMTYAALERTAEARETLTRALEIAGDSPLAQFETARTTLAGLPSE